MLEQITLQSHTGAVANMLAASGSFPVCMTSIMLLLDITRPTLGKGHTRGECQQKLGGLVLWYQKLKSCLCLFRPHVISENVLFPVNLCLSHIKCSEKTQLQSYQTCNYCNSWWFLAELGIYKCLYYVWEAPILHLSEGSETGMCTLSLDCNLEDAYFQSSLHSSSLNKSFWTRTKSDAHLLHFRHNAYLCLETATELCDSLHYKISVCGGSTWLLNGMIRVDLIVHDWYQWFIPSNPASFALLLQVHR